MASRSQLPIAMMISRCTSSPFTLARSFAIAACVLIGTTAIACSSAPDDDVAGTPASQGLVLACDAFTPGTAYAADDKVVVDGKTYACKPWPYTGWCAIGGPYAPGTGAHWREAWTESSGCPSNGGAPPNTPPPGGGNACNAAPWQQGQSYKTGDVVLYNGSYYVAEHDNPGYDPVISSWFWEPTTCDDATPPPVTPPPNNGGASSLPSLLSKSQFEQMFPSRNGFYTYEGLVEATKRYPAFAGTGSTDDRKREIAAFLANVNHETGALVYVEEIAKGVYCEGAAFGCPCAPGKSYFGRGPIQLSWNYNYCAASQSIFGDKEVLRTDPDRVARESWVAWATGLYFWMESTGAGSMTCHAAMTTGRGFGETIRTINGALECGGGNPAQVQARISAYDRFSALLGVNPGANKGC